MGLGQNLYNSLPYLTSSILNVPTPTSVYNMPLMSEYTPTAGILGVPTPTSVYNMPLMTDNYSPTYQTNYQNPYYSNNNSFLNNRSVNFPFGNVQHMPDGQIYSNVPGASVHTTPANENNWWFGGRNKTDVTLNNGTTITQRGGSADTTTGSEITSSGGDNYSALIKRPDGTYTAISGNKIRETYRDEDGKLKTRTKEIPEGGLDINVGDGATMHVDKDGKSVITTDQGSTINYDKGTTTIQDMFGDKTKVDRNGKASTYGFDGSVMRSDRDGNIYGHPGWAQNNGMFSNYNFFPQSDFDPRQPIYQQPNYYGTGAGMINMSGISGNYYSQYPQQMPPLPISYDTASQQISNPYQSMFDSTMLGNMMSMSGGMMSMSGSMMNPMMMMAMMCMMTQQTNQTTQTEGQTPLTGRQMLRGINNRIKELKEEITGLENTSTTASSDDKLKLAVMKQELGMLMMMKRAMLQQMMSNMSNQQYGGQQYQTYPQYGGQQYQTYPQYGGQQYQTYPQYLTSNILNPPVSPTSVYNMPLMTEYRPTAGILGVPTPTSVYNMPLMTEYRPTAGILGVPTPTSVYNMPLRT